MQVNRSDINRLCQCAICQDRLQDAHICPVDCDAHRKQISLFCWPCLECICVACMFAEIHAGHRDKIVLCESAAQDIKNRITNELKWIVSRKLEIAYAIGQHGHNVKELTTERDRIMNNVQEVLTEVKEQFEEACAKQQEMVKLLEVDNNGNAELRRVSEEWIKSDKLIEHLPNIASFLKMDRYNSSHTKPKPVDAVFPEFKNDLIPELIVFELVITRKKISRQTFQAEPGFVFEIQATLEENSVYSVSSSMTNGIAGEFLVALESGLLAPRKFELHKAAHLGRVKPKRTSSSIGIKIQLAKTYGEKWRQYQAIKRQEEESSIRKYINRLGAEMNWSLVTIFLFLFAFVVMNVLFVEMDEPKPSLEHHPHATPSGWWNT